jgi:hypothetical protein
MIYLLISSTGLKETQCVPHRLLCWSCLVGIYVRKDFPTRFFAVMLSSITRMDRNAISLCRNSYVSKNVTNFVAAIQMSQYPPSVAPSC